MDEVIQLPEYTDIEKDYYRKLIADISHAKSQRDTNHAEFDGMTFVEYYLSNAKAANSFLPPKLNPEDTRITSGITSEKKDTLLSSLLNYNFEADIVAHDKNDDEIEELGEVMQDMLAKSKKVESIDSEFRRELIYNELLDQGTVCVEETWQEARLPRRKKGKTEYYTTKECVAELVCGLDMYLGNIKQPFIELQPFVIKRKLMSRAEAKAKYGTMDRWKNVPLKASMIPDQDGKSYNNWVIVESEAGLVEEVKVMNKWNDDFQLLLNGCMMHEVTKDGAASMSELIGSCEYPFAWAVSKPIPHFAYGKSIPAKTKVDQSVFDEMVKLMILKFQKSAKPPLANNSSTSLSKKVFYSGTITDNIKPEQIQEIGNNQGPTMPEFQSMQFIKQMIDDKSVSSVMEGNPSKGQQTAREISELKQQSMMKMGVSLLGVVLLERKMAWLRLQNIIENWAKAQDSMIDTAKGQLDTLPRYRKVTMDAQFDEGGSGQRIVEFADQLPTDNQVQAEADMLSMAREMPVKKHYINPGMLREAKLHWFIEIVPEPRETSELRKAQFMESVAQGYQLFGPQSFQQEYLKQKWASNNNMDKSKVFTDQQQGMPGQMPGQQPGAMPQGGQMPGQPSPMPRPTVNTMQGA